MTLIKTNNNSLVSFIERILPALASEGISYNQKANMFITTPYTSQMGNSYFQGLRLSDRVLIKLSVGVGYIHTFLNAIEVYAYEGKKTKLIGSLKYDSCVYSDDIARNGAIQIVRNYMLGQAKMFNAIVETSDVMNFARQLVAETYNFQLKSIANH